MKIGNLSKTVQNHSKFFGGVVRYVSKSGNDDNGGSTPDLAKLTIASVIAASSAGDAISVKAGTYTEDINMNLAGLELWGEIGATLVGTLTLSANSCRTKEMIIQPANAVGILLSSSYCKIEDTHVIGTPTTGFDINGTYNIIRDCKCIGHTVTGFDISNTTNHLFRCSSHGALAGTRGFYVSHANADYIHLEHCVSIGNDTAGFQVVANANFLFADRCSSGGGDGTRVDAGTNNMWVAFVDQMENQHHEEIYPVCLGGGVAGDPVSVSCDTESRNDKNFWGDCVVIIPPSTLTVVWYSVGIYIHASTSTDIQQWQIFYSQTEICENQNSGNDWDTGETELTVADGSVFVAGDFVWVWGNDRTAGEIMIVDSVAANVVTVSTETRASTNTGLRYDYDTDASANKMCLIHRSTDPRYHKIEGDFSAPNAKYHERYTWHSTRLIFANGGMIMRMLNATDNNASTFDVRAIYEH